MDRSQHQRYLFYLQRYAYFGRGVAKLDAESFAKLDSEFLSLGRLLGGGGVSGDEADLRRARRSELARQLLRD